MFWWEEFSARDMEDFTEKVIKDIYESKPVSLRSRLAQVKVKIIEAAQSGNYNCMISPISALIESDTILELKRAGFHVNFIRNGCMCERCKKQQYGYLNISWKNTSDNRREIP